MKDDKLFRFTKEAVIDLVTKPKENEQFSPRVMDALTDVPINGDTEKLKLLAVLIQTVMKLGDFEHSGDWDPMLMITLKDGGVFYTENGYPDIICIGDDDKHIVVYRPLTEEEMDNEIFDPYMVKLEIAAIKSITVTE